MELVANGFPPTRSVWNESTCRSLSFFTYLLTSCQTVRRLSSSIIAGTMRAMSIGESKGTWASIEKPTS